MTGTTMLPALLTRTFASWFSVGVVHWGGNQRQTADHQSCWDRTGVDRMQETALFLNLREYFLYIQDQIRLNWALHEPQRGSSRAVLFADRSDCGVCLWADVVLPTSSRSACFDRDIYATVACLGSRNVLFTSDSSCLSLIAQFKNFANEIEKYFHWLSMN